MNRTILSPWMTALVTALAGFGLYVPRLPSTVQMGDTGEMVANAFRLYVPHPPGYPLFTWIMHYGIASIPEGSIFWRAALVNGIFAVVTIVLVALYLRRSPLLAIAFALILATSEVFWKFAELPDVFALNAFFAAAIVFLATDPGSIRLRFLTPFVFLLACAHHHTIVFLAPIVALAAWENRADRRVWIATFFGLASTFGLYSSLMLLHPHEFWSWGELDRLTNVWNHFTRADFGTFHLIGGSESGSFTSNVDRFASRIVPSAVSVIGAGVVGLYYRKKLSRADISILLSLSMSIFVFCALSNMQLFAFRLETFDRFTILPSVLLVFFCARLIGTETFPKAVSLALAGLLIANGLFSYFRYGVENDFSKNTIIEDYSINLLNARVPGRSNLALIVTDTRYNGIKYAQTVLGVQPDVVAIHPTMLFFKWYARKSIEAGLALDLQKFWNDGDIRDTNGFILDNLKKSVVLTNLELPTFDRFHVTYVRSGKRVEAGTGVDFKDEPRPWLERSKISVVSSPLTEYNVFRDLWTDYGIFYFKRADVAFKEGLRNQAHEDLEKAVELVPWSLTSRANLCVLIREEGRDPSSCYENVQKIARENFAYY